MLRLLLDKGAHVNAEDDRGNTLLLYAAKRGHTDLISLLLDKGADINAKDSDEEQPPSTMLSEKAI